MIILGINASGILHIGNWVSVIKPIINLKKKRIFLADLHSFSKKKNLKNIIFNKIILNFIFYSFDKKIVCFFQSLIKNVFFFFWILSCLYKFNKVKFLHIFKNKILTFGQISYPLLMCSDIINFKNNYIFLGIDQIQHLELYKKIKNKLNYYFNINIYKKTYFIINNKILYSYDKKKMSKSNKNELFIFSNYFEIKKFLSKFCLTLKRKKSIFTFFENIFSIKKNYFFINNKKIINLFSEKIFSHFNFFKKIFFNILKIKNYFLFKTKKNNLFYNNIFKINFNFIKEIINF